MKRRNRLWAAVEVLVINIGSSLVSYMVIKLMLGGS